MHSPRQGSRTSIRFSDFNRSMRSLSNLSRVQSYQYSLVYIQKLPANSDAAKSAAVQLISDALRLTDTFDFDSLFKLDAVIAIKDHELFSLLQVFLNGGLAEFSAWQSSHAGSLEKYSTISLHISRCQWLICVFRSRHCPFAAKNPSFGARFSQFPTRRAALALRKDC